MVHGWQIAQHAHMYQVESFIELPRLCGIHGLKVAVGELVGRPDGFQVYAYDSALRVFLGYTAEQN